MLKKLAVSTMVLSGALLASAGGTRLSANTFYPATVTFTDRQGDKITSDFLTSGSHTYVNGGADKLESGFWEVSRDFVLRARTGPSGRFLAISFAPITPAGAPAGSLEEHNLFMNIRDILTLPAGTAKSAFAIVGTAVGDFKFTPAWVDATTYTRQVYVVRSGNVWTVTADPGLPPGPGDVAALTKMKGNTEQRLGIYAMPFQITITCLATSCP